MLIISYAYIQTCMYIQEVFPLYNVRFIAINNNIDTDTLDSFGNIILNFTNFSNNLYSMDLSKKISQSVKTRRELGSFTGRIAPYGYKTFKDEKTKIIKFVIDEEVADNVRMIFKLKCEGQSYSTIISYLEDNDILTPYKYSFKQGLVKIEKDSRWSSVALRGILRNESYIGNMVQGKSKVSLIEGIENTKQKKEDWVRVENTHEPIINKELFYEVQSILEKSQTKHLNDLKNAPLEKEEDIFKGKLKCDCGCNLFHRYSQVKYEGKAKTSNYVIFAYVCPTPTPPKGQPKCKFSSISSKHIKSLVLTSIQQEIQKYVDFEALMRKKKYTNEFQIKLDKNTKQIDKANKELDKTLKIKKELYSDYLDELLTKEEYIYACTKYKDNEISLKNTISSLEEERTTLETKKSKNSKYLKNLVSFKNAKTLTKEMVDLLIDEIKIHDRNDIEIIYHFNIAPPTKGGKK